jgi:catechol 2,3-dioxygenase-like lactoylglutathione lyase family enzyme
MSSKPRICQVGILTNDLRGSLAFYQNLLGLELIARFHRVGFFEYAILADGNQSSNVLLQLTGPSLDGLDESKFNICGQGLNKISFQVDDLNWWRERLESYRVSPAKLPPGSSVNETFHFRDPCGVNLEFTSIPLSIAIPRSSELPSRRNVLHYRISHLCITSDDLADLEYFYVHILNLTKVGELPDEGIIFLADSESVPSKDRYGVLLELFGPSGHWSQDCTFLEEHGPGLQYLCFAVDDVDAAFSHLSKKGVEYSLEPTDYLGNRIAFFKDPNGIDIEILQPLTADFIKG